MNAIENAIKCMYQFHETYKKSGITSPTLVQDSMSALSESQKNFVMLISPMEDPSSVYPVTDVISSEYTLADLVMAYHLYLKEKNSKRNIDIINQVDHFYKV